MGVGQRDHLHRGNGSGGGGFPHNDTNKIFRSTDGGATWANTYTGSPFAGPGVQACSDNTYFTCMFPDQIGFWRHEGWGEPAALNGVVHLVYAQHGAGNDAGDVFHIRSTDNGVTFSAPLSRLVQFLPFLPLLVAFTFSVLAEPPAQFDCTIRYWNEALQKERPHDYDTGYYTTKVAPSDIAWLQPGMSPVGRPGRVDPGTVGFVVIGSCSKGNITSSTELRNIMIKLR